MLPSKNLCAGGARGTVTLPAFKPAIRSILARVVGSTPTRFRHICLVGRELQKNVAAKGGIKRNAPGFVHSFQRHE